MAYYNTKIGIKYPSLKYDFFGKIADACQRKGIALAAYLNAGISSAEGLQNRDWTTIYFDGRSYREPRLTAWVRTMCYNTKYRDHLIGMVEEIANNYPVSGFFIDCLGSFPCVCPVCLKVMKKKGIDYNDIEEPVELSNVKILLRNDRKMPKKVYLAPEMKSLKFKLVDGYVEVTIPECKGYSLVVFE